MTPDPIALIIDLLSDDGAVTALAAGRVFGGGLPTNDSMPRPCVVVSPAGGSGRPAYELYRRNRIDTVCYGETLNRAWQLHLAVRDVLENLRPTGALFSADTSSDGALGLDPDTQWPTCFASYTVLSAVST